MPLTPLLATCLLMLASLSSHAAPGTPLQVVVSVLPQQYLVERIGAERVAVLTLVQPGDNEATYAPGPATLAALDGARVWFTMGVPFEDAWLGRISRDRPRMEVVPLAAGLPLRRTEASLVVVGRNRGHDHAGAPDPHTWTDPRLMARMAERVGETLARIDAPGAELYTARAAGLRDELLALHEELAATLAPVAGRTFIVFHPSWGYFADAYALEQLPIETGGREPGPRGLAEVIQTGRQAGARAVFVQPQFSQRSATAVAQALGARLVEADPLAPDYTANLRRVAAAMAAALAEPPAGSRP